MLGGVATATSGSNAMLRKLALYAMTAWLGPIAAGSAGAAYKMGMFRSVGFNPELEPLHIQAPPLLIYLALSIGLAWLATRLPTRAAPAMTRRCILGALMVLCSCYAFVRAVVVETALVQKYAYCCCCEKLPTLGQTYERVLAPFAL